MNPLEKLSEFFFTFIEYEPVLERARIALATLLAFDPYLAFKEIDRSESGFVTADDLYEFFHQCSVRVELRYVFALVKCYNSHSEGKVFIADFFNMVLPHTKNSLREDALTRHVKVMQDQVLNALLIVFGIEFEMWERVERIKFDIGSLEFDPWKVFCSLDVPRSGFLTPSKIKRLLDRFGRDVEEFLVGAAIARVDKDGDFMLCFEEFAWGIGALACKSLPNDVRGEGSKGEGSKSKGKKAQAKRNSSSSQPTSLKPDDSNDLIKTISEEEPISKESNLLGLFKIIIEVESSLETSRKKLLDCPDFNLFSILKLFDQNLLGFSTESDFSEGLETLNIKASKSEVILIFKHYSLKYSKRLKHEELEKIFLPYLETNIWPEQPLEKETLLKLKSFLEKVIRAEVIYEKYRQLLKKQKISEKQTFGLLGKTQVSAEEVKKFVQSWKRVNEKEVSWVMGFFKKTVYETFTADEFSQEFLPKLKSRL